MFDKKLLLDGLALVLVVLGVFLVFFVDKLIPADATNGILVALRERNVLAGIALIGGGYYLYMSRRQQAKPKSLV